MTLSTDACPREGYIPDCICTLTLSNRSCSFVCAREESSSSVGRGNGWGVSCFSQVPGNRIRSDRCSSLMLCSVDWLLGTDVSGNPISLGLHDPWNQSDRLSRNVCNISSYQSTLRNTPEERNFHLHHDEVWHHADDCKSFSPFHHRVIIAVYTGCNRRNGPDFGRVFLMLNYTEKPPKHLYPKLNGYGDNGQWSLKLWQLLHTYWLQIHIETGRNMWFL